VDGEGEIAPARARVRYGAMRNMITSIVVAVCLGAAAGLMALYGAEMFGYGGPVGRVVAYAAINAVVTAGCLAAFLGKR
jgi:hypothetical protein